MTRRPIVAMLAVLTAIGVGGSPARAGAPPVVTVTAAYFDYYPGPAGVARRRSSCTSYKARRSCSSTWM